MSSLSGRDREYWSRILSAGGFSAVPRSSLDARPGVAESEVTVPDDLLTALVERSEDLAVPLEAILLAAHVKVLSAVTGEAEVTTGYVVTEGGDPLPCPLTVTSTAWRGLIEDTARVLAEMTVHQCSSLDELRRELGRPDPSFEVVFSPSGQDGGLDDRTVLRLEVIRRGTHRVLRVIYRTNVLDEAAAARIVGYHLTALRNLCEDIDAEHTRQTLLSPQEWQSQIEGYAARWRERPDRRVHEMFEDAVRRQPETVAAVHGEHSWTYGELNRRANQLARALLARGVPREGVVGVVTERNLDWMAAVLAVFKAGGAYLPIEPHFPADRIATTLSRAGCQVVLTEAGSTATLDTALETLPGLSRILIQDAYGEGHDGEDLSVPVAGDQLAYIYFTSGSTGTPKGAMCEHAGFVNHVLAKIEDLGIGAGTVVAQTAPQCFDISLWQLVSAVLVGGRTLIIEQDVILDVPRFVDKVAAGRINVLQLVPSYLEAVLTYLERQPRELPDLSCVSVTGEAVKKELTQRWFTTYPGIALVNAYGLTETSDDTNHEVMHGVPDRERVPLGPPIPNVVVTIVDDNLMPVPLGAPGLITFSGVCVGRGYVNDPERTRQAFLAHPHRPGERMYLAGDYGRWLPEGKLEFLGRRDNQVKISGFRIEIGEIENTLLAAPGVRDGAVVVVAHRGGNAKHLVAFYTSDRPVPADLLRDHLARSLPAYMVPSSLHWRASLPLTANSKIDRRALTALADDLETTVATRRPPVSATEQRVATAWAGVLGIPVDQIGREDDFFARGGTSLSAVKLAIALNRAVSLKDLLAHPVLADLADLIDGRQQRPTGVLQLLSGPERGPVPALVCFPYAGGNAVNFQPLATALRGTPVAVYAVELPGHDLSAEREPFASLPAVVDRVISELTQRDVTDIILWGHSSGSAFALETARHWERRGLAVRRIFLGAQLLGTASARRSALDRLLRASDADLVAVLTQDLGHAGLADLDQQRTEHLAAAYRHDCAEAHRYLAELAEQPPSERLNAPITVVVAADDPSTSGYPDAHLDWAVVGESVDLLELAAGGHYFLRTRPEESAEAVRHETAAPFSTLPN
jgi:amino acid adenylation domain-containing protein